MRILLVSDLHYTLPQFDWIVAAAPDFDLVVLAGDHLDVASAVPLDAQSVVVERYVALLRGRTTVVVSSGNHDLTGPDAADACFRTDPISSWPGIVAARRPLRN